MQPLDATQAGRDVDHDRAPRLPDDVFQHMIKLAPRQTRRLCLQLNKHYRSMVAVIIFRRATYRLGTAFLKVDTHEGGYPSHPSKWALLNSNIDISPSIRDLTITWPSGKPESGIEYQPVCFQCIFPNLQTVRIHTWDKRHTLYHDTSHPAEIYPTHLDKVELGPSTPDCLFSDLEAIGELPNVHLALLIIPGRMAPLRPATRGRLGCQRSITLILVPPSHKSFYHRGNIPENMELGIDILAGILPYCRGTVNVVGIEKFAEAWQRKPVKFGSMMPGYTPPEDITERHPWIYSDARADLKRRFCEAAQAARAEPCSGPIVCEDGDLERSFELINFISLGAYLNSCSEADASSHRSLRDSNDQTRNFFHFDSPGEA